MEILYKNKNFIAVNKPIGTPSQKDQTGAPDAMTLTSEYLASIGEPSALWLVHRLDRVVGGILVFARTKSAAASLSAAFAERGAEKYYLAVIEGEAEGGEMRDFLYKDSAKGKAFVVERERHGVKEARLEYSPIAAVDYDGRRLTLVTIKLHTGRFHQIRAQFASRRHFLVGDGKYGSKDNRAKTPALFAYRLALTFGGKEYEITATPDLSAYPWSLFDVKKEQL